MQAKQQNNTISPIWFWIIVLPFVTIFSLVMLSLKPEGLDESSFDQRQQERFAREAESRRAMEQFKLRQEINKIKGGYYD